MNNTPDSNGASDRDLHEQASRWLLRQEAEDFSDRERAQLECWLEVDDRHRRAFQEMATLWGQLDLAARYQQSHCNGDRHNAGSKPGGLREWIGLSLAAAAVIVLMLLEYPHLAIRWQADFYTGHGQIRSLNLADGSQVRLNTDSALNIRYSEGLREVELLQGEAYFQVQPNPSRPFRVIAGNTLATALGTAYVVRREQPAGAITVTEGRVEVQQRPNRNQPISKSVEVTAGATLDFTDSRLSDASHPADHYRVTAWMRGKIIFDGEALEQVIAELSRYHPGYILITGDELKQRRVSGVFSTDDPVHIVESIARTLDLQITRLGGYFILLHPS
ncbi:MAG: FecR family protein [Methylococcales bacterium]